MYVKFLKGKVFHFVSFAYNRGASVNGGEFTYKTLQLYLEPRLQHLHVYNVGFQMIKLNFEKNVKLM